MSLTPTQLADALSAAVIAYVGDSDEAALQATLREIWTGNGLATEDLAMGVSELVGNVKGWMRFGPVSELTAAATVDLGAAATHLVTIAGDSAISSFGDSATLGNPIFEVKLTGSPLLVHSADLVLPGEANIQGGPGDAFMVEALGDGAFKVWFYFRSDGTFVNSAIAFSVEAAVAEVQAAKDVGLGQIDDAISAGAVALGLPVGGIVERIPASEGYFGGHAFTDANGWTTPDLYLHPGDVVGDVYVFKTLPGDLSGETGAVRIYVAPAIIDADYSIVFWAGQSDASGADAVPMPSRTTSSFAAMLDTVKPTAWTGSFGATLSNAVGSEYIFSTDQHQGTTYPLAAADALEQLIEDLDGEVYADHGKRVLFVQVGLSSSDVPGFSYPSAHFTKVIDWANAVKAACDLAGKTVKVKAIVWAGWGAYAYQNGQSQATVEGRIDSYCGAAGSIATYILPIFGQTGEVIPVGICNDFHHYQGADPITPQVAMAEQALIAAQPSRYSHIQGKGNHYLNGADRGWGGSTSHHHPNEEEFIGAVVGWWLHSKITRDGETWPNYAPTGAMFTRTAARKLTLTLPNWPSGAAFGFSPTGLYPTGARPNYGWFLCDPATPTTEIALTRLPYGGTTPGTLVFETATDLPTNLEVRYGCRTSSDSIAGNTVIRSAAPLVRPVKGVATEIFRTLPALKVQVP